MRRRGGRQRGQIIPLMALLMLVITGFVALAIDSGVGYTHSRNDQDIADAAALAASSWIFQQASPTTTQLTGAYTAATNVAALDCTTSSCPLAVTFYNQGGYTASSYQVCQVSAGGVQSPAGCLANDLQSGSTTVSYVGAAVTASQADYFANLGTGGSRSYRIQNQAVAAVWGSGGSGGTPNYSPTAACEICVFGNVTSNGSGNTLSASGGSIDIGGYVFFDSGSNTIQTATGSGYGIEIDGDTQHNNASVYSNGSSNLIEADGILDINGGSGYGLYFNSSHDTVKTNTGSKSNINISGSVHLGSSGSISPSSYGTTSPTPFIDPLATTATPTYGGASAPTYSGLTDNGSWTYPNSCPSSQTLNPGIYTTIQDTSCSNVTINFNPGLYVLDGSGSDQGIFVNSGSVKLAGTGVTFYLTCNSGGSPAACGTWNPSSATCGSTSSGAQFVNNASAKLDLAGGSGGSNILFFADRCNSSNVFYVNSSGLTADSGYPSGALYAHSGTVYMNASTNAIPAPMLVGYIYYNSSSSQLGSLSGSISLGGSAPTSPGGLVQ